MDCLRVDAVPYLFEREGTSCESLPETHEYLQKIRSFIDTKYGNGNKILLAEANQMPEETIPYFGDGSDEFHMLFLFPLMPRLFYSLAISNANPIKEIISITKDIPRTCQWCTFLRNHDELTLEMVTPEVREFMWEYYAPDQRMRLNLGIRRRLAPLLGNDRRKIELMVSLLFSLIGSPVIYAGDEIGMGDNIELPDRSGLRTPMQWSNGRNAGFSNVAEEDLHIPIIKDPVFGPDKVNVKDQQKDPSSLLNFHKKLIKIRKKSSILSYGDINFIDIAQKEILMFIRELDKDQLLFLYNLADESIAVSYTHLTLPTN